MCRAWRPEKSSSHSASWTCIAPCGLPSNRSRPAPASKGVTVIHALADAPLYVKGDAHRLRQVFTNLLSNAVKFNRDGGTVEVHAERSGQDVVIRVSDTGKGISNEMLARVFGRFWQADSSTRRAHGGLGLGLSIVRYLVELHGGVVRAESAGEDRGTTLVVTLPVPAATPATVLSSLESGARAPSPAAPATPDVRNGRWPADDGLEGELLAPRPLAGRRVLIVDANADDCDLLCTALRASGAETRAAGDAHRALAAFDAFRPDVIVCDVAVPISTGAGSFGACVRVSMRLGFRSSLSQRRRATWSGGPQPRVSTRRCPSR